MGSARQIVTRTVCTALLCGGLLGGKATVVLRSATASGEPDYPVAPFRRRPRRRRHSRRSSTIGLVGGEAGHGQRHGRPSPGSPRVSWGHDADGAYDDATGLTASVNFSAAGRHVVKVQSRYPDGDRAIARTTVTV